MKKAVSFILAAALFLSISVPAYAAPKLVQDSTPGIGDEVTSEPDGTEDKQNDAATEDKTQEEPTSTTPAQPEETPADTGSKAPEVDETKNASIEAIPLDSVGNLLKNGGFETPTTNAKSWPFADQWGIWSPGTANTWTGKLDTENKRSGNSALNYTSTNRTTRITASQSVQVQGGKAYVVKGWIKTIDVASAGASGVYFRVQIAETPSSPKQYLFTPSTNIKGTTEWTEYSIYIVVQAKTQIKMDIEVFLEYATGTMLLDDFAVYETYALNIQNAPQSPLSAGSTVQLGAATGGETPELVWASANPDVASVSENGLVTALAPGKATITVKDKNGPQTAEVTIDVEPAAIDGAGMRLKWRNKLTGNDFANKADSDYKAIMQTYTEEAALYMGSMLQNSTTQLWPDLNLVIKHPGIATTKGNTADLTTAYRRLRAMALAYTAEASTLHNNPALKTAILYGLNWMYDNGYNEKYDSQKKIYGNWWDWFIGMPQNLADATILMYEELSPAERTKIYKTLEKFNEDPTYVWNIYGTKNTMTSANLLDTSLVSVLKNIIGEKGMGIALGSAGMLSCLPYVTSGDGFYKDGSCIQHSNIAYTGGYGIGLLRGIEKIIYVLDETEWEINDPLVNNVYEWIWNGYRPLVGYGAMMDMVSGRGVTRQTYSDMNTGRALIQPAINIAKSAPPEMRTAILAFAKQTALDGIAYYGEGNYFTVMAAGDMAAVKALLADASIPAAGHPGYVQIYGAMDKAAIHSGSFSAGVSMYSKRTGNFEYGNGENKKGWHAADGALYLYMGDYDQFGDAFWATVNTMRLPGITTDHTPGTVSDWYSYSGSKTWVGGSSLGAYGSIGMELDIEKTSLTGKKSWFALGDEIVALGAGIQSNEAKATETIVENRKITGNNSLYVNGVSITAGSTTVENAQWAWLQGNLPNGQDSTGYYFPTQSTLSILREEATGSWYSINNGGSKDEIKRNYASLAIPHGEKPNNEQYAYVLLPGYSKTQTTAYASSPAVEILANTPNVQAAQNKAAGITGMNFWNPAALGAVQANTPLSVTMQQTGNTMALAVADPTQANETTSFVLQLDTAYTWEVTQADSAITTQKTQAGLQVTVATKGSLGKSFGLTLTRTEIPKKVQGITLSHSALSMNISEQKALTAAIVPQDAANKTILWKSSNPQVAAVSATGVVQALAAGTAVITAATPEDAAIYSACTITVAKAQDDNTPKPPAENNTGGNTSPTSSTPKPPAKKTPAAAVSSTAKAASSSSPASSVPVSSAPAASASQPSSEILERTVPKAGESFTISGIKKGSLVLDESLFTVVYNTEGTSATITPKSKGSANISYTKEDGTSVTETIRTEDDVIPLANHETADKTFPWLIVLPVALVVLAAGLATLLVIRRKRQQ